MTSKEILREEVKNILPTYTGWLVDELTLLIITKQREVLERIEEARLKSIQGMNTSTSNTLRAAELVIIQADAMHSELRKIEAELTPLSEKE